MTVVQGTAPPSPPPGLPGWGHHVSVFQRRQAAFWLFIVLLALTALVVLNEQLAYLDVFPAGWLLSVVLLAAYVVPVAVCLYVLDLFEREPISLVVAAFLWGGVVAIGLSAETNGQWFEIVAKLSGVDFAREWGAALVAPPVEETFKFLGVVVIYLIARREIDDLFDGFIYGALVGLGFAAVENVQYFVQAIAATGGGDQVGPVIQMFLLRVIFVGPYMHVLWSGIAGLGLAYYVTQRDKPHGRRLFVAAALFVLAVVAHFVWNSPILGELVVSGVVGQILYGLIKGLPFFVFLALLVVLAHRRERRWFAAATAGDLGSDVLTHEEAATLGSLRQRLRARRLAGQRLGPQGSRQMARLQREQIRLAMIRSRVHADDHPDVEAQRHVIRGIRAELAALPHPAQPGPSFAAPPPATTLVPPAGVATAAGAGPPAQSASSGTIAAPVPAAAPGQPSPASVPASTPAVSAPASPPAAPASPPATPASPPPPAWFSTPPFGLPAWDAPDPARPPSVMLPPMTPLRVAEQLGAWARVVAVNGWTGWVDGRYLVPR